MSSTTVESQPTNQFQEHEKDVTTRDEANTNDDQEETYITGIRLMMILVSGTLVQFVMMLDQSIIATVWLPIRDLCNARTLKFGRPFPGLRMSSTRSLMSGGTAVPTNWPGKAPIAHVLRPISCLRCYAESASLQPLTGKLYTHLKVKVSTYKSERHWVWF